MKITTHVDNGLNLGLSDDGKHPVLIVGETRIDGDELIEVPAYVLAELLVAFVGASLMAATGERVLSKPVH